jgi:DNA-binding CsgD family transcriptional regulator
MRQYIRGLEKEELINLFIRHLQPSEEKVLIPISIFNTKLTALESVVKYLRDDLGYSNAKTAKMLMRSSQTVWITYRNATRARPGRVTILKSDNDLPLEIFATKESILAAIVAHLRKRGLTYSSIAKSLKRSPRTIATVSNRTKKGDE